MYRPRKQPFQLLRSFVLADAFTFANASCGTVSIFLCLNYLAEGRPGFVWAIFVLLPLALVFDVLDGYIARWRHRQSPLGADLDSLADSVSFGVAPAILGFTLGLRGFWDAVILTFFVACGISRLARYNVTASALADASGKVRYYEGVPIPMNLLIVVLLALAFATGNFGPQVWFGAYELGLGTLHPLTLIYAVSGFAMSSTLRIPKL